MVYYAIWEDTFPSQRMCVLVEQCHMELLHVFVKSQGLTMKLISLWNVLSLPFNNVFVLTGYLGSIVYYMLS